MGLQLLTLQAETHHVNFRLDSHLAEELDVVHDALLSHLVARLVACGSILRATGGGSAPSATSLGMIRPGRAQVDWYSSDTSGLRVWPNPLEPRVHYFLFFDSLGLLVIHGGRTCYVLR